MLARPVMKRLFFHGKPMKKRRASLARLILMVIKPPTTTYIYIQVTLTLIPVTDIRLDLIYNQACFCWSVTDVTENSRLFASTSTTYCTRPLCVCVCLNAFFTPQYPAHPVSVPIHPSDENSVVTSFETDICIASTTTRYQVRTGYAHHACGIRVVFLEHGGGALGIFKSPVCTYNLSWTSVRFT